ncbi:Na/Pi cotransporter family protein, partial [Candidatus Fermentibacteria bacterium]|nr:Na/Pi cotransporter family protein [Candidatus Fermentibacteria bacterium]
NIQVIFSLHAFTGGCLVPAEGFASTAVETDTVRCCVTRLLVLTDDRGEASTYLQMPGGMGNVEVTAQVVYPGLEIESISFIHVAVDVRKIIFETIGGLALFLLGMKMMSEGLQHVAGSRMKSILARISDRRFLGLLTGAGVTAVIQSSSATTVILVSFLNTGLMTLRQAMGVIYGANIGTTVTGQIIAFNINTYAFPLIAAGFLLTFVSRESSARFWGRVLLGFGLLLLGMNVMKGGIDPLRDSRMVKDFFTTFSRSPFMGILAGTLVTCVLQSSSATVGLTMTLAGAGLVTLEGAVYLVLGDNIGTTITAQLAALGGNKAARRAAMGHTLFNLIGAAYFGLLLARPDSFYMDIVRSSSGDPLRQVANAHSLFNIFNAIVFLPLLPLHVKLCNLIIPGEDPAPEKIDLHLEPHLVETPVLAVDAIERGMVVMAKFTADCVKKAMECFLTGRPNSSEILPLEDQVDEMQTQITIYASRLFSRDLEMDLSLRLPVILHSVNDIERVSDHAVNMVEARDRTGSRLNAYRGPMLDSAARASKLVEKMLDDICECLEKHDRNHAEAVLANEEKLNALDNASRSQYTASMCVRESNGLLDLAILDFISYCERIGDHLTNIAQSVIGGGIWHGELDQP